MFDTEETKSTSVLNRLIAEAAHPQADVFWSGDPVRPFSLIKGRPLAFYSSPIGSRSDRGLVDASGSRIVRA